MAFAPGPYDLMLSDKCSETYKRVLLDCVRYGVTRDMIEAGLSYIKADCDQGDPPSGAELLDEAQPERHRYGITIHSYRFYFKVEEWKRCVTIFRIVIPDVLRT